MVVSTSGACRKLAGTLRPLRRSMTVNLNDAKAGSDNEDVAKAGSDRERRSFAIWLIGGFAIVVALLSGWEKLYLPVALLTQQDLEKGFLNSEDVYTGTTF